MADDARISTSTVNTPSSNLTTEDRAMFARFRIPVELVAQAGIERLTHREAREYGFTGHGDLAGVVFPYRNPATGGRWTARLRRDNPEIEGGKEKNKYLSAYGDRHHLYFPPGSAELMADPSVPVVLVEAEKSSLALTAWAVRMNTRILPVGMGGCYGWRGRTGKIETPNGSKTEETGPLPDLDCCNGRRVVIMLDTNASTNRIVRRARFDLARELTSRNATVVIATLPDATGCNGPDDAVSVCGDQIIRDVIDNAILSDDVARKHLEQGIRQLTTDKGRRLDRDERDLYLALLADVSDGQQREILVAQFSKAYRELSKQTIKAEVQRLRDARAMMTTRIAEQVRNASLRNIKIRPAELIDELEVFYADRLFLPQGGALTLAFFTLNTWTYDIFDTTPYLNVESAVPGCGKSTVLSLLRVCRNPIQATALTESTMFRVVSNFRPTLLIDEAESLEGKSERAQLIRMIANVGYKKGALVPRTSSEETGREIEWFDSYGPKVFAVIGGLTGTLLERSIVLHMDKKPQGIQLKRCRERILNRIVPPLREHAEAYSVQARDELTRLYDVEPDEGFWPSITDREAEIWGPLLIHTRLMGAESEARLLAACAALSRQKTDIQSEEWNKALSIELREALEGLEGDRFSPADLLGKLGVGENWATKLAKYKEDDSKSRASAIGRFIQKFRFKSRDRTNRGISYLRSEALEALSRLTAENSFTAYTLSSEVGNSVKTNPVAPEVEKTKSFTGSFTKSYTAATSGENTPLNGQSVRVQEVKDFSGVAAHTHIKDAGDIPSSKTKKAVTGEI